jgi:hypothetical protein
MWIVRLNFWKIFKRYIYENNLHLFSFKTPILYEKRCNVTCHSSLSKQIAPKDYDTVEEFIHNITETWNEMYIEEERD